MGNILQRLIYNLSAMAPLCFIFALLWYWQKKTMDIPCIVMCIGVALVILFMISFSYGKRHLAHVPVVKELLNKKYDALAGIECAAFKEESNQKLLQDINSFLEKYYDKIRHEVKEQEIKNQLSYTLITKILMGTLGCVPAYDRYFIAGIKNQKVATGNYNLNSIMQLVEFYERNSKRLEPVREKMEVEGMPYPQMKMLDMGFWQVGFDLDTNKGIKTAH